MKPQDSLYKTAGVDTDATQSGLRKIVERIKETWPAPGRHRRRQAGYRLFRQCHRYRRHRSGDLHRRGRVEIDHRADDAPLRHDRHRLRRDERQRRDLRRRAADLDGRLHRGREIRCRDARRRSRSAWRPAPRQAGISISGGEISPLKDVIRGFDLVGMAVGIVPLDRIITGRDARAGRCHYRAREQRHPQQRLDPGAPRLFRAERTVDRPCLPRARHTVGRRTAAPDPDLRPGDPRNHRQHPDGEGA